MNPTSGRKQEYDHDKREGSSEQAGILIELLLSVPGGLEDVAVRTLPPLLVEAALKISYRIGSGYLTVLLENNLDHGLVKEAVSDLVQHPPMCLFAAYVDIGKIRVPRPVFDTPNCFLNMILNDFKLQHPHKTQEEQSRIPETISATQTSDHDLQWQHGISILRCAPTPLSKRLYSFYEASRQADGISSAAAPIRYRASFDRGDVQHKGVRSQDIAAGLGGIMGDAFPHWNVDLKNFEVEVIGRWKQDGQEEVDFKLDTRSGSNMGLSTESEVEADQNAGERDMIIQVGMTLPLALESCPYRHRPVSGRTSLKMEIAYTLLAMAGPTSGDLVMDFCTGVGTIPIVGAAQFPGSMFVGCDYVSYNIDKAKENSAAMVEKVNKELSLAFGVSGPVRGPILFMGDVRSLPWRSGTVDLIVSDLPWGLRENSHVYNCKLYPKIIREIIRLLKVNGRAVLVTGERKLLQRVLDAPYAKPFLTVLEKREVAIGFKVMVFELMRL
ncbi:THUMP domain-containing protein 3 [Mortierella claussenii]|nr:THUMP domain-containing protein 3 [Mortierella claussenii]